MPNALFPRFRCAARLLWERWTLSLEERLRRACARGDLDQVQRLIARGADVNAPRPRPEYAHFLEPSDRTALHVAALCGHPTIVARLLDSGALPLSFDRPRADTPAHLAAWRLSERLKDGRDAQPFRDVLGLLQAADADSLRQGNRFSETAMRMLPGDEGGAVDTWGTAYHLKQALPAGAVAGASRRARL